MPSNISKSFFEENPVFLKPDFLDYLSQKGSTHKPTQYQLFNYYLKKGLLVNLCRNLYAVIPVGKTANTFYIPESIITAKITKDSIPAYHTALELHGLSYSVFRTKQFFSHTWISHFYTKFCGFESHQFPKALVEKNKENEETQLIKVQNISILAPTKERAVVDAFHKVDVCGGWEEVLKSLIPLDSIDFDRIVKYALLVGSKSLIGKIGYFFEGKKDKFNITENDLRYLEKHKPHKPVHTNYKKGRPTKFLSRWNIVIPLDLFERSWDEASQFE